MLCFLSHPVCAIACDHSAVFVPLCGHRGRDSMTRENVLQVPSPYWKCRPEAARDLITGRRANSMSCASHLEGCPGFLPVQVVMQEKGEAEDTSCL